MKISIIIPVLNEKTLLLKTIEDLVPYLHVDDEIIIVDGGSVVLPAKGLPDDARIRVLTSSPGRGMQLNYGAVRAQGDILLFLYVGSSFEDPAASFEFIREVMEVDGIAGGAFKFKLDIQKPLYRLTEKGVHWRVSRYALPYGDQGFLLHQRCIIVRGDISIGAL